MDEEYRFCLGFVYVAINQVNGKVYVGQTTKALKDRISEHKTVSKKDHRLFYKAVRKYGLDNFTWEVIDTATTKTELNKKEIFWIEAYCATNRKYGYNIASGGEGGPLFKGHKHTKEVILKLSEMSKGFRNSFYGKSHKEESKRYGRRNHMYGRTGEKNSFYKKKHPPELQKRITEKVKNAWKCSDHRNKMQLAFCVREANKLGITVLQYRLLKVLKEVRKRKNPFYGKQHTEETKQKIQNTQFRKGSTPHNKKVDNLDG